MNMTVPLFVPGIKGANRGCILAVVGPTLNAGGACLGSFRYSCKLNCNFSGSAQMGPGNPNNFCAALF